LLAQFANQGATIWIVIATGGGCGSYRHTSEELVEIRRAEACLAAGILGAQPPIILGHPDFQLDSLPGGVLRGEFIRQVREKRPDIVIAEDPYAQNEPHPDHRVCAWAASEAVAYAELPLINPEHLRDGLQTHMTPEKYFYANNGLGSNRIVDISDTIDRKIASLLEHKSQVEFLVEGIYRQAIQAGLDISTAAPQGLTDPAVALGWSVRTEAAEIGARGGVAFGEAYRYARYHPFVETLLG
jgi:LmbE family N-acetylglucosaminyl deacetylase